MRINLQERIAGQPVAKIRRLLKKGSDFTWDARFVMRSLGVSRGEAGKVIAELARQKLIEPDRKSSMANAWQITTQGNAFAGATAAHALRRQSAESILDEFLKRVEAVKADPRFLYKVSKVVLFGSYLSDRERINDIDLAVTIVPKEKDTEKHGRLLERRVQEAKGVTSSTSYVERLTFPQVEVMQFLKGRSRGISLTTGDDKIIKQAKSKIIYRDNS